MSRPAPLKNGLNALLTPQESVLILIDHQPFQFANLHMLMAGVVPMNWLAVASEWQRDWARQDSAKALGEAVLPHAGATGAAFAWELQLLGQKTALAA